MDATHFRTILGAPKTTLTKQNIAVKQSTGVGYRIRPPASSSIYRERLTHGSSLTRALAMRRQIQGQPAPTPIPLPGGPGGSSSRRCQIWHWVLAAFVAHTCAFLQGQRQQRNGRKWCTQCRRAVQQQQADEVRAGCSSRGLGPRNLMQSAALCNFIECFACQTSYKKNLCSQL